MDVGDKHEAQSEHRMEKPKEQKDMLKEGKEKKAGQAKETKSATSKTKEPSTKYHHEPQEEAEHWRVENSSVKRAKVLARIPRAKLPIASKELILITTPPKKGKEGITDNNRFLALAEGGQGEADYDMIDTQEEEQMEEDEVEEYVPLSQ